MTVGVGDLAQLDRAGRIAALRAQMHALVGTSPQVETTEADIVPVSDELDRLLPHGGLARRQVTECADCPALIVEMIGHITATGGHVGIVGWPDLSLAQVGEYGDLSQVVVVPDPGVDPWSVTSVLVEGLDLVVHHGQSTPQAPTPQALTTLSPTRARPILAKLRGGQAALVTVGERLPGASASIAAQVVTYRGIGAGSGRITGVDIALEVSSPQLSRSSRGTLTCGQRARLAAV